MRAFNSNEFMNLIRELEKRRIDYSIEYRRTTDDCDGIVVKIDTLMNVWEIGFYAYDHIEAAKYVLSGDVQPTSSEIILRELDKT